MRDRVTMLLAPGAIADRASATMSVAAAGITALASTSAAAAIIAAGVPQSATESVDFFRPWSWRPVSRGAMCFWGRHRTAAMQRRPVEGDRRRVGNVEAVERSLGRNTIEPVTTGPCQLAQAFALRTEDEGDPARPRGIVEGFTCRPVQTYHHYPQLL